jgi:exonuclease III
MTWNVRSIQGVVKRVMFEEKIRDIEKRTDQKLDIVLVSETALKDSFSTRYGKFF